MSKRSTLSASTHAVGVDDAAARAVGRDTGRRLPDVDCLVSSAACTTWMSTSRTTNSSDDREDREDASARVVVARCANVGHRRASCSVRRWLSEWWGTEGVRGSGRSARHLPSPCRSEPGRAPLESVVVLVASSWRSESPAGSRSATRPAARCRPGCPPSRLPPAAVPVPVTAPVLAVEEDRRCRWQPCRAPRRSRARFCGEASRSSCLRQGLLLRDSVVLLRLQAARSGTRRRPARCSAAAARAG